MEPKNYTPFSILPFEQVHRDGPMMVVLVVRGTFDLYQGRPLVIANEQTPVQLIDEYLGEPDGSPLLLPTDLVPHKPSADISVIGNAYSPGGAKMQQWKAGIRVGKQEKVLDVYGQRFWNFEADYEWLRRRKEGEAKKRIVGQWRLGEPTKTDLVRLSYELAYGGPVPLPEDKTPEEQELVLSNPIGRGVVLKDKGFLDGLAYAPSIVSPDQRVKRAGEVHKPEGFAPIPPFWAQRSRFAGTYDKNWLDEVHPRLPDDFDYRFYQSAHPDLIYDGYLKGKEQVQLVNMVPGHENVTTWLPDAKLYGVVERITGEMEALPLNLDTLHFDLTGKKAQAFLTWRGWVLARPDVRRVDFRLLDPKPLLAAKDQVAEEEPVKGGKPWLPPEPLKREASKAKVGQS